MNQHLRNLTNHQYYARYGSIEEVISGCASKVRCTGISSCARLGHCFSTGDQARLIVGGAGPVRCAGRQEQAAVGETGGCLVIKPGVECSLSNARQRKLVASEKLLQMQPGNVVEHGRHGDSRAARRSRRAPLAHRQPRLPCPLPGIVLGSTSSCMRESFRIFWSDCCCSPAMKLEF